MGIKVEKPKVKPRKAPPKRTEEEILHPERVVKLSDGRRVTVREVTFAESLTLYEGLSGVIDALATDGDGVGSLSAALATKANAEAWIEFVSLVSGLSGAEIAGLPAADGYMLTAAAYGANVGFLGVAVGEAKSRRANAARA